jgi:hypothetical protein
VSAALTASSLALRVEFDGQPDKLATVSALAALGKTLFDRHVDVTGAASYAAMHPDLAKAWPASDASIPSAQYFAAAWLGAALPKDTGHKDVLNYYFSYAEARAPALRCAVNLLLLLLRMC